MGRAYPNPLVGCVVRSKSQKILSTGFHSIYGQEHAEVAALKSLDLNVTEGALLTVSLEPCNHFGKTPPCTELILEKKIGHVFFVSSDPNPLVSGQGIARLALQGVKVTKLSEFEPLGQEINQQFFRQFVSADHVRDKFLIGLKIAMTRSGVYAQQLSSKKWITGVRSREYGHCLRAFYQSIVVGSKTVLLDNPRLDIRHPLINGFKNKRVVLDPDFSLEKKLHSSDVFSDKENPTILVIRRKNNLKTQLKSVEQSQGVKIEYFEDLSADNGINGAFSFKSLFSAISKKYRLNSFLIEGGAATWSLALDQKCVDRLHLFLAQTPDASFQHPVYFSHPLLKQALLDRQIELGSDIYEERSL
jgi:diaminohydroxyphosphoribosylaminopyrimidine deaminase/5-amino-6-(5-phosphoribosylamino)uracil reductase